MRPRLARSGSRWRKLGTNPRTEYPPSRALITTWLPKNPVAPVTCYGERNVREAFRKGERTRILSEAIDKFVGSEKISGSHIYTKAPECPRSLAVELLFGLLYTRRLRKQAGFEVGCEAKGEERALRKVVRELGCHAGNPGTPRNRSFRYSVT